MTSETNTRPTYTKSTDMTLYVVRTNPDINSPHHGLRSNTSEYVATFGPGAGDEIVYALHGRLDTRLEPREIPNWDNTEVDQVWVPIDANATIDLESEVIPRHRTTESGNKYWVTSVALRFGSHPGRACTLGEDGLEDSFGQPILEDLFLERIGKLLGLPEIAREWRYAPIEVTEEEDYDNIKRFSVSVKFAEAGKGWRNYESHTSTWKYRSLSAPSPRDRWRGFISSRTTPGRSRTGRARRSGRSGR